jgi:hypothetical protein
VTFVVQFIHFRRGVPEVIRTLNLGSADAAAALARAKPLVTRSWPSRTDAIRVMDDGGRTLIDWTVPPATLESSADLPIRGSRGSTVHEPPSRTARGSEERLLAHAAESAPSHHRFNAGQPVSYAEHGKPEIWTGGYEIIALRELGPGEPQYVIRNVDETHDHIVQEHELQEGFGRPHPWPVKQPGLSNLHSARTIAF